MNDPQLSTVEALAGALEKRAIARSDVLSQDGWTTHVLEVWSSRCYYPRAQRELALVDQGPNELGLVKPLYRYFLYLAQMRSDGGAPSVLFVASPYRMLLERVLSVAQRRAKKRPLSFARFDMDRVWKDLGDRPEAALAAIRITMQMLGDEGLDLVSLTGSNPLRSKLRDALKKVSDPYAVRVRVGNVKDGLTGNVDFERQGVFSWYQRGDQSTSFALLALATAASRGWLVSTESRPVISRSREAASGRDRLLDEMDDSDDSS
jgi:hypothetical protein